MISLLGHALAAIETASLGYSRCHTTAGIVDQVFSLPP